MSDTGPNTQKTVRTAGLRGHGAAIAALVALAAIAIGWFWMTRETQQDAGLGAPHGVIVIGGSVFVTAVVAYIRNMDASDVLEMLGALVMGFLALIGAILKGIWNWFLGLIGLD